MFKILSLMFSVMSMIGIFVSVKYVSKAGAPAQAQILQQFSAASQKQDDAIRLITGQKGPVSGVPGLPGANASVGGFNLASLMGGGTPVPSDHAAPAEPAVPDRPMTAICSSGAKDDQDESADTEVKELPPDTQAKFVDGRLQIFYPNGKPRTHR